MTRPRNTARAHEMARRRALKKEMERLALPSTHGGGRRKASRRSTATSYSMARSSVARS